MVTVMQRLAENIDQLEEWAASAKRYLRALQAESEARAKANAEVAAVARRALEWFENECDPDAGAKLIEDLRQALAGIEPAAVTAAAEVAVPPPPPPSVVREPPTERVTVVPSDGGTQFVKRGDRYEPLGLNRR